MTKRTNLFPSLLKPREINFLKAAGASLLLLCAAPQWAVADTYENTAVTTTQQSKTGTVTGIVKDENGEPLIGVSVVVKGTTNGTITDMDGKFTLNAKSGDALEISYIGYSTVNVKAGSAPLNIVMKEDAQKLDEVVVVGYGSTTKRAMVASVSTVKASEMENLPISNITQGLAGRAPGLIVQGSGGGINKTSKVSIRGGDTPLVVIDGVIRDYNDFVTLNPEDVEAMSVLKDASATAVYGARATNGILQVTTKKGKKGKPSIEYSFNQSWAQPNVWPDKLDAYDYASYTNIAQRYDKITETYTADDLQKFRDGSDPYGHPNTNYYKLLLRNFAPQSKHSIRLSGGNEMNQYYASVSMLNQRSLYRNDNNWMKRTNFQLSETTTIESIGLKINMQVDGYTQNQSHPLTSESGDYKGVFAGIQDKSPISIGVNSLGLTSNSSYNPVKFIAEDTGYRKKKETVVKGLLNLEWSLPWVKGLKARAKGSYRFYQKDDKDWNKEPAAYDWNSTVPTYAKNPSLSQTMETGRSWTWQYFAEYNNSFGKHNVSALGGYECSYSFGHKMGLSRDDYAFVIDQIGVGPAETMKNSGSEWESGRAGWIGQVKYNYDNRYMIEGSIRYDGSDNFRKGNRWGAFYSGSVGWAISDEAFMETIREKHIFDLLKFRASYGEVGLDNWGDENNVFHINRFAYLSSYGLNSTGYVAGGKYVPTFTEGALPSPDLTWFTTRQFDAGFDFSSLNNRLYGSLDYFYYSTKGFLYAPDELDIGYTLPLGVSFPKVSTEGENRRAGFEFQLGWRDDIEDFHYDVSVNFTKFDELWASDPREGLETKKNPYKRTVQQTGYAGVYLKNQGFFNSVDEIYNSPVPSTAKNLSAGDLKYYDFNGDGIIDDADKMRTGKNSFPRANYGININLSYKGFSFSTLFQGATRFDKNLGAEIALGGIQNGSIPRYAFQTDYWTPDHTNARYPRLVSSTTINNANNTGNSSDFWLINGAYFRMKDIRISYDFKKILLKNVNWLSKVVVGVSGQNLFTISEMTKYGLDPETADTNRYEYPNERVFAINFSLGF
ncbi:SusC/RagA family TonB-linked outer membrane protein [Bacteroides sp.]